MNTTTQPKHFIEQVIDTDVAAGKYPSIITRFPPEPNGFLHIGHAKSICLNFGVVKAYNGVCHLRFDDTNPSKESQEYINAIQEDVQWLGFDWAGDVRFSSDYFDTLYQCAVELIEKGLAYVCFLSADEAREYRGTLTKKGKNSPHRDAPVGENLAHFARMKAGEYKAGECVLRAKIDMGSPFMCMRDPTIYRIRFISHHQQGDQWCIYPMYDFTHCISDAIEKISHSLCTLEFQDNRRLYDWFLDNLAIGAKPRPYQYEFARLNLDHTIMSKRLLNQLVDAGLVNGWDDPRMPTISGLRRRGFPPQAIVDFCQKIGITKQDSLIGMGVLEDTVREHLNASAPRAMAVLDPIKLVIENYTGKVERLSAPNHPQDELMGRREIFFSDTLYIDRADFQKEANKKYKRLSLGKEVRLRNAYVVKANRVEYDACGEVAVVYASYDADTLGKNPADGRKIKGVIHFVEASRAVPCDFHLYEGLFLVENPVKAEVLDEVVNPNSLVVATGFVEPALVDAPVGVAYQFERQGYFCKDSQADNSGGGLLFNRTVTLRDVWQQRGDF